MIQRLSGSVRQILLIASATASLLATAQSAEAQGYQRYPAAQPIDRPKEPRIQHLGCQDLYSMTQGLTPAAWQRVAGFPLSDMRPKEARELEALVRACKRSARTADERMSLILIGNMMWQLVSGADSAEADRRRMAEQTERKSRQANALAAAKAEFEEITEDLEHRPDEPCNPHPSEVAKRMIAHMGEMEFQHLFATLPEWRQLERACEQRQQAAAARERQATEEQQAQNLRQTHQNAYRYAEEMRRRHSGHLSNLGLPAGLLDSPLNIADGLTGMFSGGFDTRPITLGQWLALIREANPNIEQGGGRDPQTGDYGFSLKSPSERTMTFYVQKDGSEWFVTRYQQGSEAYAISAQYAPLVSMTLANLAALPSVLARARSVTESSR